MPDDTLIEGVYEVLKQNLGLSDRELSLGDSLTDDYGADSLDSIEILMELEDRFKLEISDEEWDEVVTVQDCINLISSLDRG